uniref:Translocon Sec61/SecY plug domain-containing protein n=1 Tax=Oryza meridionalis TaxID=40149 RepID=A0A0E0ETQ7_9ORYZ
MSNRSKFWRLAALVPEVQCPDQPISPRQKFKYTAIVLFIFVTASQVLLYGIQHQPPTIEPDPLQWVHLILASSRSTLLSRGILAILVPEVLVKIWVYLKIITLDTSAPETGVLMNRAQRLLGILVTILGAVNFYVRSQHFTVNTILCSDIIVIYLDDVLRKGYGLLSGISLFTATNICVNILWKAFSPMSVMYPEQSPEFEGAVIAWVHLLMTRTDKLSAISKAFFRQNLPNIINLIATCLFVPLAIFFQGFYIVLPVRTRRNFQAYCHIKLSHFLYGPVVLHRVLLPLPYVASKVLYKKYSGNILVNLLGKWDGSNHFGQSIPVGGIVYYLTTPPILADLHRDPFHAFIYVAFVLISCVFISMGLMVCASSKGVFNGFVVLNMQEERRLRLAQPDSIHANEIRRHVIRAACVGGFCAGVLIIFADFIGVFCSGTGIMLAVTASYPYVDGRASEVGSFGF